MRREEQQYGAWLRASFDKPVRRIEVKVTGRSNVPRWGQKSNAGNSVSSENQVYEDSGPEQLPQQVNDTGLGSEESEEVMEQSPSIKVHLSESNRDFERDLREIDAALHDSPPNVELPNQESACNTAPINSQASRDLGKPQAMGTQGSEVDKAIEELRNHVVIQDILGTKATDGDTLVHRESRGAWRRLPRAIAKIKVAGGCTKMSEVKRAGDSIEGKKPLVHGKKKGKGIVAMEEANVQKRLDRVVASVAWMSIFTMCTIDHLPTSYSDHVPILLHMDLGSNFSRPKRRPRKFEEKWSLHPKCEKLIKEVWDQANPIGSPMYVVIMEG
ncbi:pentatricopeptide repeat-containing protein At1g08070, chloroplastic-like [Fagus crenata]